MDRCELRVKALKVFDDYWFKLSADERIKILTDDQIIVFVAAEILRVVKPVKVNLVLSRKGVCSTCINWSKSGCSQDMTDFRERVNICSEYNNKYYLIDFGGG